MAARTARNAEPKRNGISSDSGSTQHSQKQQRRPEAALDSILMSRPNAKQKRRPEAAQ